MRSIAGFIIRSSAFIQKELVEILRQTRLILALILGPFLILLLFGLGFRNEARVLRTVFVIPESDEISAAQIEKYATTLGPQLDFRGVTTNQQQALFDLARGRVDVVAVIPGDVEEKIRNSEQPLVKLYHREIDPLQASYVEYFGQIYVGELNRRILRSTAEQGQQEAADVQDDLQAARASARAMRIAFEQNDAATAQQRRREMRTSLDTVALGVGASLGVLQGIEQTMSPGDQPSSGTASQILGTMGDINSADAEIQQAGDEKESYSAEAQKAAEMETDLAELEEQLADFRRVDPDILVSPFKSEAESVVGVKLETADFFAPGVIVLLLQHLAVTFAALSIVRERNSGAMELFRVSPISAFETLIGKYLSYFLLGAVLAASISALVVLVLGVPMLGDWNHFALVLAALLFASLGLGFLLSLVSNTTSQAVQYSMLVLLFSIFFSGFFLDLRLMTPGLRFLSWGIPTTYGMQMLQEIMFRGAPPNITLTAGLVVMGVLLFVISWLILRYQMRLH